MNHQDRMRFLKHATYTDLLRLWRFEPNGSDWFKSPYHDPFYAAFDRERNKLTIPEQMEISKSIGFKELPARGSFDQRTTK
jgi:hypothetical protein